jgi:C-3',4' desaturase CrtD
MDCEVVVVGAGIGGLTVASLLAQRGVDVCVLERESQVGGCAASFEKFGYRFESGNGLYTGWKTDGIHARIFAQLPVPAPETWLLEPSYAVRLPDGSQVSLTANLEDFNRDLARAFPECTEAAISFYRKLTSIGSALEQIIEKTPGVLASSPSRKAVSLATHGVTGIQILRHASDETLKHLEGVSRRFRRFIDIQLQTLAQGDSSQVSYLYASLALANAREGMFGIRGGAATLAERLADSIKLSGGRVRLNSPVLRLSYDSRGEATGVDLLSGETVQASRAIISNLTIWDTYGKLVGLNRSPAPVRKQLRGLRGWGAYLVYAGMEEAAAETLPERILSLTDWQQDVAYDPEPAQLVISVAPQFDPRAPAGKRAVTVHAFTDVDQWFTFHRDETELEGADQRMLDAVWERLHKAVPELGSSIEVIDTVTPRGFYDQTRRKLGMVGGLPVTPSFFWESEPPFLTSLPNLFIVSDTTTPGGVAGASTAALDLANHIADSPNILLDSP